MKRKSEFGKLKWLDLVNSLYHAFVTVIFITINVLLGNIQPTMQDYKMLIGTFLTAFFMSLFKTSATNSNGEVFKKEN